MRKGIIWFLTGVFAAVVSYIIYKGCRKVEVIDDRGDFGTDGSWDSWDCDEEMDVSDLD